MLRLVLSPVARFPFAALLLSASRVCDVHREREGKVEERRTAVPSAVMGMDGSWMGARRGSGAELMRWRAHSMGAVGARAASHRARSAQLLLEAPRPGPHPFPPTTSADDVRGLGMEEPHASARRELPRAPSAAIGSMVVGFVGWGGTCS